MAREPNGDILIVDDTPNNLRFLSTTLTEQGYKVRSVTDGLMALTVAQAAKPDLILLDIMMPNLDGYEVCQRLKANEQTRDIPVIFLSALDEVIDKVKAFTVGGVDYITKPFQLDEVLARIETHLSLRAAQKEIRQLNAELEQRVRQRTAQLEQEISERLQPTFRS
jgi:DNA-binding response OmpR family regulator